MEVSKLTQQSTSLLYNLNYVSSTRNICQYLYKKRHPAQEYFICFCTAVANVAHWRRCVLEGGCGPVLVRVSDIYIVRLFL